MSPGAFEKWLDRLGYSAEPALLHRRGEDIPDAHPYALEIKTLLKPEGAIRARAVFEVEGVPTVVFVSEDDAPLSTAALDEARKKIWNQNLATVVIEVVSCFTTSRTPWLSSPKMASMALRASGLGAIWPSF